jgi:hypothetical protein
MDGRKKPACGGDAPAIEKACSLFRFVAAEAVKRCAQ